MKKIICLFIIVLLFTGCESTSNKDNNYNQEGNIGNLYYKYPSNAETANITGGKRIKYDNYSIIISFKSNKKIDERAKEKGIKYNSNKRINKIKWQVYKYSGNVSSIIYMNEKDKGTYYVTFAFDNQKDINQNKIRDFMNHVYYK